MNFKVHKYYINIVALFVATMFFSCNNSPNEVRDLLKDKNRPIGQAKNINHRYKENGIVKNILRSPLLLDYSNRYEHPYQEFPLGVEIVMIKNKKDSTKITGKYAVSYERTGISEIVGNVIIHNYSKKMILETNQLFWDQKKEYVFTEEGFRLTSPRGVIKGYGFESKQNLTEWVAKDLTSDTIYIDESKL